MANAAPLERLEDESGRQPAPDTGFDNSGRPQMAHNRPNGPYQSWLPVSPPAECAPAQIELAIFEL
jgi:hypothetical protein